MAAQRGTLGVKVAAFQFFKKRGSKVSDTKEEDERNFEAYSNEESMLKEVDEDKLE